jgi:hypothetical protein
LLAPTAYFGGEINAFQIGSRGLRSGDLVVRAVFRTGPGRGHPDASLRFQKGRPDKVQVRDRKREFNGITNMAFSPDGKHFAWLGYGGKAWNLFCDEKAVCSYPSVSSVDIVFSPDGRRYSVLAAKGGGIWYYSITGKDQETFKAMGVFVFSPDSRRWAYYASPEKDRWCVVLDGKKGKMYSDIMGGLLAFSPDSRHCVFPAKVEHGWTVVVDGREGPVFGNCWSERICFTEDKKFHYLMLHDGHFLLIDEEISK